MRGKHGRFWASLSMSDGTLTAVDGVRGQDVAIESGVDGSARGDRWL